ncbi:nucleotidyltransferase [Petroclostridium xylanilyticum]|uniref:nucleotidyltransferase n=1 Tax=Petroclostridium xylanilyticum TaxID=1792311 RepID=UPI000B97F9AB|nr:nucleotidyltransferase [Petroclostridium xylanilyticum]
MRVLGLITEYNPFHNGHKYHLETSKNITAADYVVCVMSGNFIQRGEPALLNKWAKTKMALMNGVDLVIELPVTYVLQSAEYFAFGAVKILDSLNIVTDLCFGSEWGKIDDLKNIAGILFDEPVEVSLKFKQFLDQGDSFVKAREKAIIDYMKGKYSAQHIEEIMSSPNNILAIEYIKALYKLNSNIRPVTIKRYKTGYHSLEFKDEIASATAIRNLILHQSNIMEIKPYMPLSSFDILNKEINAGKAPIFTQQFETAILSLLRKQDHLQLALFPDVNEGLENRIQSAAYKFGTYEEVISAVKTKRYTRTRLQRIMLNILLGITQDMLNTFQKYGGPQYIRVLGMNSRGKELLKAIKKKASLPIIIKPSSYKQSCNPLLKQMIELDFLATDLYSLHYPAKNERKGRLDLLTSPVII